MNMSFVFGVDIIKNVLSAEGPTSVIEAFGTRTVLSDEVDLRCMRISSRHIVPLLLLCVWV